MAEVHARFRQFEYKQNSNLVIQKDGPGPSQNEPTGEPESLAGRIVYSMGDKVMHEGPKELREKVEKKRKMSKKAKLGLASKKSKLGITKGETVLDADVKETAAYRPSTPQTRIVYEQLLTLLQQQLGDQAPDIVRGAVDEVLASLKTDNIKDSQRKTLCEEVLGIITTEQFTALMQLSKKITDFKNDVFDDDVRGDLDEPAGVAVVFDEEDEDDDNDVIGEIGEDDEDSEEDTRLENEEEERALQAKFDDEDSLMESHDQYNLDISTIDSHWLQRELGRLFPDSTEAGIVVAMERQILGLLKIGDLQECENKLVGILKYENFDFAKLILKNKWKVLYCTQLKQAQSDVAKDEVMKEMENSPEGLEVLELLQQHPKRPHLRHKKPHDDTSHRRVTSPTSTSNVAGEEEQKQPGRSLDLEQLAFSKGSHLLSSSKCVLPRGSTRIQKKGYEEVRVVAEPPPAILKEHLKPIEALPEWARAAFLNSKIRTLNPVQSKVFDFAFNHVEENMLICAPTGAGKTNVALLTMLGLIEHGFRHNNEIDKKNFKIIYIAPMKALVAEQVANFSQRLEPFGLTVRELTGDISLSKSQIEETQVIITTPEKWDIITRKAGDRTFTQLVRLLIIDEIHLLHDSRGPVLEAIIARTVRQVESTQESIRLIGLSATLPNFEDVAAVMNVSKNGLFTFSNSYRPVPLQQEYIGITEKKAIKRFNTINEVTYQKVVENAGKHQVLVFVHSRKETVKTARSIRDMALSNDTLARFLQAESAAASREILQTETESIKTLELKELLPYGFAVHHAGLPRTDRKLIEDLFNDKHIQVLVCTATLAWGVNLPAHTVIIKGTQVYLPEKGRWCELSPIDVMQMMGRAGRPGLDEEGHGILITSHSELQFYLSLNNQQLPIESQLISMLPDMLNAEIVLGSIQSRQDAVKWLMYTYLYIRMRKNPSLYGIENIEEDITLEQRRIDLAHSALVLLNNHGLVKYDKRTGNAQVTALGRVASHYYIGHPSIAVYNEHLKPSMSDIELLRLFSLSHEFKFIPVREEEKAEIQKLLERVPIPVKGGPEEASTKVNILLQSYMSKLKLEGFATMSDMIYVQQSAGRIMRAIFEICLKRGWASLALRALNFFKMIDKRMWTSQSPLRQFNNSLSEEVLRKLEKKDFSWDRYYDLTSTELGELIRIPKLGKTIHRYVHQLPKLELAAYVQPITRSVLLVELTITPDFQWEFNIHGSAESFWIIVEDVDSELILHHELFILRHNQSKQEHCISFTVPLQDPPPPQYFVRVVSDRWLHSETVLPISFKTLILPSKNPPNTELLDLQPLPVTALKFPAAEELYLTNMKRFNPIQTQLFSSMYLSNESSLICAPASSGKIECLEFAILKMLRDEEPSSRRCVYISPYTRTAKERYNQWSITFGKKMGLTVSELTGESSADVKILEVSHIVISTPANWDLLSRRWKQRKTVQEVRLFIVDELQLLDFEEVGSTMEVVVSRMRYISAQLKRPIRIIGMAASLANAKDVGEWIGSPASSLFNFGAGCRPSPIEVVIHGFDTHQNEGRLLSMRKQAYLSIKRYAPNETVLIFTPDRKQCRLTAIDMLLFAAADKTPKRFLHISDAEIKEHAQNAREKALAQTLEFGVGFIHEGFSATDRAQVELLFKSGALQVLVVTEELCWGMSLTASLVVIVDTKKYHGREGRYIDYPVADVLEAMGRAAQPAGKSGTCVLLCGSSKREFYKKFIYDPLPVESHLDEKLSDSICAEIVMKTVESKQDAVDWLTWTFYYRRLSKNPNYYGLQGVSHQHLSDHLSELVESTVESLEQAGCITVENDTELAPLNLGLIASYYYIRYTTIELVNRSVTSSTKRKGLIEILCAASEFEAVSIRPGEESSLRNIAQSLGLRFASDAQLNSPQTKTQILIYAHFNRTPISSDLSCDQKVVVKIAVRLLMGIVDVIASNGWLHPALTTMELSQMIVQAMSHNQSELLQLPHISQKLANEAKEIYKINDIFDLMNLDDDFRNNLFKGLTQTQISDIAQACNRYPSVALDWSLNKDVVESGSSVELSINLERDSEEEFVGPVYAVYFPTPKDEHWWLVIANTETNNLVAIKRVNMPQKKSKVKIAFDAPEETGTYNYTLYLMSDCYMGIDQEIKVAFKVT
eukprot:GHVL01008895.1.p1 GENE.GHVL01008895.1~~GHVL01008895.1.p1  ORF type:complete len:2144 (+),score=476.12 GHVL01008895.1:34-6465(+)